MGRELEIHVCDNCSWSGAEPVPVDLGKLGERIEPGGVVPSGECPQCGALCYPQYCDVVFTEFDEEGFLTGVYGPPWLNYVSIVPRLMKDGISTRRRLLKNALRSGQISGFLVPTRANIHKDPSKR